MLEIAKCPWCQAGADISEDGDYVICTNHECRATGPTRPIANAAIAAWARVARVAGRKGRQTKPFTKKELADIRVAIGYACQWEASFIDVHRNHAGTIMGPHRAVCKRSFAFIKRITKLAKKVARHGVQAKE